MALHRIARCYERRTAVIDAFFDLADTIITVMGSLHDDVHASRCRRPYHRTPAAVRPDAAGPAGPAASVSH